jgi:tricarballylate dehydrogenase
VLREVDVIVVGGGNAALCAAISARENGASVLVLERAPFAERGGNSTFTAGAMRFAYANDEEIRSVVTDLSEEELARTDFGTYTERQFFDDLARVTENRTDPELADLIVSNSLGTLQWMRSHGVRFLPIYGRQAFEVDGRFKFWGGLTIEAAGGGPGLVDFLTKAAERDGVEIAYGARALSLVHDDDGVHGVNVRHEGLTSTVRATAVVLASGGFQANPEWRTRYLGAGWDLAKVRGTRFNTGDGIKMALEIGAAPWGQWSGSHAVSWEFNAPNFGDLSVGDSFQKHSYPFGVMINSNGERFVNEGLDFRNYTYAKYGREVLRQPGQIAWQVFDSKVQHLLRDEYRIRQITKVEAGTLEELATKMDGMNVSRFVETVTEFNNAVDTSVRFNPNEKDGLRTTGLQIDKTNWANPIDTPPFEAYAVTCGITFTFGGLHVNTDAEVIDEEGATIPGLFACGELVGGIFYFNYPGGSGLTSGAELGRIAGRGAATR